jgi:hypothetical protein
VVDVQAHSVRDRLELVERDVQTVGRRVGTRRDKRVASAKVSALDSRKGHRDALPGLGAFDRPVVHLNAANAHVEPARLGAQDVSLADRARPERPVATVPIPRRVKTRSTKRRVGPWPLFSERRSAAAPSASRSSSSPCPVLALVATTAGSVHELPRLLGDELDEVGLGRHRPS